ncbi:MAG TPA: hypothetical protein VGR29_06780 [Thermomicrobiales bacterium]|nr:hypothetical protein [Thermomicrobiales bacterium]
MTVRQKVRELGPSDFKGRPVTEEELAAWAATTPEQQALFKGEMTPTFRWLLDRYGERFPEWLETAVAVYREQERLDWEGGADGDTE